MNREPHWSQIRILHFNCAFLQLSINTEIPLAVVDWNFSQNVEFLIRAWREILLDVQPSVGVASSSTDENQITPQ